MKVESCKKHGFLEKEDEDPTNQLILIANISNKLIWPMDNIFSPFGFPLGRVRDGSQLGTVKEG